MFYVRDSMIHDVNVALYLYFNTKNCKFFVNSKQKTKFYFNFIEF